MTISEWLIPYIKKGLSDDQVWSEYLTDPIPDKPDASEEYVKRYARIVREVLTKAENIIGEDINRATRLLNRKEQQDDLNIAIHSYDINDISGLKDWANIKDDEWECYSQNIRASQNASNPWFIVEGKFRRKQPKNRTIEELVQKAQETIETYYPQKIEFSIVTPGRYLLELSLPDLHLGNMNYDDTETLETTSKRFKDAINNFLQRTSYYKLDEILVTFGSDFFTINADLSQTKKGTPQDINTYYDNIYDVGLKTAIDTIYTLRQYARKVYVIGFPGNHDEQSSVWLMLCLKYMFKDTEGVFVDWEYNQRKYHRFGCTAIAYTHKLRRKLETLPLIMMQEMINKNMLDSQVKYYEIHGGDTHVPNKQELPAESTQQKITQRVLSSLTDSSRWANDNFGPKVIEAQAFVYDYDNGIQDCLVYRPK